MKRRGRREWKGVKKKKNYKKKKGENIRVVEYGGWSGEEGEEEE